MCEHLTAASTLVHLSLFSHLSLSEVARLKATRDDNSDKFFVQRMFQWT